MQAPGGGAAAEAAPAEAPAEEEPLILASPDAPGRAAGAGRTASVDALRGLCVLLMIWVDECGDAHPAWIGHSAWDGLRLADFVMPWFLFVVGVSLALAASRADPEEPAKAVVARLAARAGKLFLLGVALQGGSAFEGPEPFGYNLRTLRLCGILNRIGACYLAAGAIEKCLASERARLAAHALLLGVYATATYGLYVPSWRSTWGGFAPHRALPGNETFEVLCDLRGHVRSPECTAAGHIDRLLLGQNHLQPWFSLRMPQCSACAPALCPSDTAPPWCTAHMYDPEGVLPTLACVAMVKIGVLCGGAVLRPAAPAERLGALGASGASLLIAGTAAHFGGLAWNKQLFSLSYVAATAGAAALVLAALHWVGDVRRCADRWWWQPLQWTGRNALLVFVLHGPLEAVVDTVYWSDGAGYDARYTPMSVLRDSILGGNAVAFASVKTAALAAIAGASYRRGWVLRV